MPINPLNNHTRATRPEVREMCGRANDVCHSEICYEFANLHIFTHERAEKYAIKIHATRSRSSTKRGGWDERDNWLRYQYKRSQIKWVGKRQQRAKAGTNKRRVKKVRLGCLLGIWRGCYGAKEGDKEVGEGKQAAGQSVANFYWRVGSVG